MINSKNYLTLGLVGGLVVLGVLAVVQTNMIMNRNESIKDKEAKIEELDKDLKIYKDLSESYKTLADTYSSNYSDLHKKYEDKTKEVSELVLKNKEWSDTQLPLGIKRSIQQ